MKPFGKYQLFDEIGTGAAGVTWQARDPFRNRELALKILQASATPNPEFKEKLCRDLAACSDLRHPHIVAIHDLGEVDGVIYVAAELLDGAGLQERRTLPFNCKLKLMAQVCEGLAFAHSKGIAHGNIKPSNIFVAANKDAKILDFGIARAVAARLAADGSRAGVSPNYLAPEQVLGQPFDARSDLFSTAVVLYELLVDTYPFPGPAGLIPRQIVHTEPEPLRKLDPRIPEELEQLLTQALNKNPGQRLETADQFASALYTIVQKLPSGHDAAGTSPARPPLTAESAPATLPEEPPTPAAPPPAQPATVSFIAVRSTLDVAPAPIAQLPRSPAAPEPPPVIAPPPVLTNAPPPKTRGHFQTRLFTYTAAAVLGLCILGSFLSRQNMRASQNPGPAPAAQTKPIPPSAPEPRVPTPAAAPTASETLHPPPPADQILLGQINSLWESGKYNQAMALVNTILASNPTSPQARAWKKKIRAAQVAETAMQ